MMPGPVVDWRNEIEETQIRPGLNWNDDKKGLKTVVGQLDHFSRYAVAW